jgi:hypothetical protein
MVIGKGVELRIAQGTALVMGSAMGEDKENIANLLRFEGVWRFLEGFLTTTLFSGK